MVKEELVVSWLSWPKVTGDAVLGIIGAGVLGAGVVGAGVLVTKE